MEIRAAREGLRWRIKGGTHRLEEAGVVFCFLRRPCAITRKEA